MRKNILRISGAAVLIAIAITASGFHCRLNFIPSITPETATGGEGFLLKIENAFPAERYIVRFNGREYSPYNDGAENLSIFIPVEIEAEGEKDVEVSMVLPLGLNVTKKVPVNILARDIKTVRISSAGINMRRSQPAIEDQQKKVLSAINLTTPVRHWQEPFIIPLDARISAAFALKRERGDYSTFHRGVDLAAPTGTPVKAINCGIMALRGEDYNVYGNLSIIDHGQGVVSCYFHLDRVFADTGQRITRGEIIGEVGNTGWSSGPHLHWGVYLQGEAVDPHWWVDFQVGR